MGHETDDGMRVTRMTRESYTMRKGHDQDRDVDILLRTYDDGTVTVSFRPGREDVNTRWSREVPMILEKWEPLEPDDLARERLDWIPLLPEDRS